MLEKILNITLYIFAIPFLLAVILNGAMLLGSIGSLLINFFGYEIQFDIKKRKD